VNISALEARLSQAQQRYQRSVAALAPKHKGGEWEEYEAAYKELISAERELSLAKGEETALACDWEADWDKGAPLPHVIASGNRTYLLYFVSEPDPNWDGTYTRVVDPADASAFPIALVEFVQCEAFKFGGPNDEVFHGHPLHGKGLEGYRAHMIANSRWLAELETTNSVHRMYDPAKWKELKHYMLLFHDEMFECIATSHRIEIFRESFEHVLEIAKKRIFKR
jgi:hypothetical protein